MNFSELQDQLSYVLDFNDGQTSQAFSTARIQKALNFAYKRELNKASLEGNAVFFQKFQDCTWLTDAVTFLLPTNINQTAIIEIRDVTDDSNGVGYQIRPFWKDNETLQWGIDGPSEDRTIRFWFYARAQKMINPTDRPVLLPEDFHELLIWSAACDLRRVADETSPAEWREELLEWRLDFHKYVSRGRPIDDVPRVLPEAGRFVGLSDTDSSTNPTADGTSLDHF